MQISTMIIPQHLSKVPDYMYKDIPLIPVSYETIKEIDIHPKELTSGNISTSHFPKLNKGSLSKDDYLLSVQDLSKLDQRILFVLNEQLWSTYSFKALVRKLNIHQQTLTRSLKRLLELNLIIKSSRGYQINEVNVAWLLSLGGDPINNMIIEANLDEAISRSKKIRKLKQLLQIYLPVKIDIETLVSALSRKWFGNLRWFGLVKKDTGYRLEWVALDKYSNEKLFQVIVNIVADYVIVESDAEGPKEKVDAMSYSNKIVNEVIKTLKNEIKDEEKSEEKYPKIYTDDIKYAVKKNR